jgi:hypothetical protein
MTDAESSLLMPNSRYSALTEPRPMPRSSRPFDSTSSIAKSSATSSGLCSGRTVTAVPMRMFLVARATTDPNTAGLGMVPP